MPKRVAILQSNYIPWKGYFDLINKVDEFIFYDEVQYTKNDWRNRNLIKTPLGLKWISIPVRHIKLDQKISETVVLNSLWRKKHWNTIKANYSKALYFKNYKDIFEDLYLNNNDIHLCEINYKFIRSINKILRINTKLSSSVDYNVVKGKTERLVDLCKKANATEYVSGPAAQGYLNENLFFEEKINVSWNEYSDYKKYNQLFPPFKHEVSILDLIFNEGENATLYMKSFG